VAEAVEVEGVREEHEEADNLKTFSTMPFLASQRSTWFWETFFWGPLLTLVCDDAWLVASYESASPRKTAVHSRSSFPLLHMTKNRSVRLCIVASSSDPVRHLYRLASTEQNGSVALHFSPVF
jgi:hypothetical protein